jgi:hypothetical protein
MSPDTLSRDELEDTGDMGHAVSFMLAEQTGRLRNSFDLDW